MLMHLVLHSSDDTERQYVSRKGGGRELASSSNYVDASIQKTELYTIKSKERLISVAYVSNCKIRTNRKIKTTRK